MKTVLDFAGHRVKGRPISMVTCYDYWSAGRIEASTIDAILVGDSVAMVMHGESSTLGATLEMMEMHVRAVRRGAPTKCLVADLPFLSHRKGLVPAMEAVERLCRAGAQAVKLEGAVGNLELIRHIVESGIPVMGHLGLTPQSVHAFGGHRVQGRTAEGARRLEEAAGALESAGCFAIVLECIPEGLGRSITGQLTIPTIGIGSGPGTSGQILVLQDLLGLMPDFSPVFVRKYLEGANLITEALENYARDVRRQTFPTLEECYPT